MEGQHITYTNAGIIQVPDQPIIPYIVGDGIGADITPVMIKVIDHAVASAYGEEKKINWLEIYAGQRAIEHTQIQDNWLPAETLSAIEKYKVAIKGPLSTPTGGGIRSLNVAIRQRLDLYACIRPVVYFKGINSPLRMPEKIDMVVFRENTEDIYAGIEWQANSQEVKTLIDYLQNNMQVSNIRFPDSSAIGIKPVSREGSERLINRAINFALEQKRKSVTLIHKGNIMKYTEGAFMQWGYALAKEKFGAQPIDGGPWLAIERDNADPLIIKDCIADNFLQQALINPQDFDVLATLNLNGDYVSDALAAQVGGIGIAPGGNISDQYAVFEATHGTAPKHAGLNKANPSSLLLSAHMMLEHLGWSVAADKLFTAISTTIEQGKVTYDLARGIEDQRTICSSSDFGDAIIANLD